TGKVERMRRRIYETMWFTAPSCGLRHAPEERQRPLCDTGDVLAPRRVAQEKAGRRIDNILERRLVEALHRSLLLIQILRFEPGRDLLFHSLARGPAKPRLVASATDGVVDGRIDAIRARMPGVKHPPSALARQRFL